jgi:CBS domain-containing protein
MEIATVGEVMTTKLITAPPEETVDKIAKLMADHDIGSVVITQQGCPIGIITEKDISFSIAAENRLASQVPAEEIMTRSVKTIGPEATVIEASKRMAEYKIRRLPVVEGGRLVGIVTDQDVLPLTRQMIETLEGISGYVFNLFYKGMKKPPE